MTFIVPAIQDGFGLAFSALGNTSPDIPPPSSGWPTDGIFVSLDSNIIIAAGNAALSLLNIQGTVNYSAGPLGSVDGNYDIQLGPLSSVVVNSDGTLVSLFTTIARYNFSSSYLSSLRCN